MKTAVVLVIIALILTALTPAGAQALAVNGNYLSQTPGSPGNHGYRLGCPGCPGCPDNPNRAPGEPGCY